jgi:hypothetical protein
LNGKQSSAFSVVPFTRAHIARQKKQASKRDNWSSVEA